MAYLGYERVAATDVRQNTGDVLTPPAAATHAEFQASEAPIRYWVSDSDPAEGGMVLLTTHEPRAFLIADAVNMTFIRDDVVDGTLNVHYIQS